MSLFDTINKPNNYGMGWRGNPTAGTGNISSFAKGAAAVPAGKNAIGAVNTAVQGARAQTNDINHPGGTESGPGILESWFNQRANGTDPGYEYALKRNSDSLDSRYAAGGSYNSGARTQGLSDMYANMAAQREGQLDSLAGGASGEHQGRLNSMFAQGLGLAGGESGINTAYDLSAAGAMTEALKSLLGLSSEKAGVDSKANQGLISNSINAYSAYKGLKGS